MHRNLKSWSAPPAGPGGRLLLRLLAVSMVVGLSLSSSVSFFSPHQAQAAALSPHTAQVAATSGPRGAWVKVGGPAQAPFFGGDFGLVATNPTTGNLYQYNATSGSWTQIGGPAFSLASSNGTLYAESRDASAVYQYSGSGTSWVQVGGPASALYGGGFGLFATDPTTGNLYQYNGTPGSWTQVGGPGLDFAVTDNALYGISSNGSAVYQYTGTPTLMSWVQIGGPATALYANGSNLFATDPTGNISQYAGTPMNWVQVGGPAGQIFAGGYGLFATNLTTGDIYRYRGLPNVWTQVGGPGIFFAVTNDALYGVAPDESAVYRYSTMNAGNATVVFVHGFKGIFKPGWDCLADAWGPAIDYLGGFHDVNGQSLHWGQQDFRTIQYYSGDTHCGQSTGSPGTDPNNPTHFNPDNGNEDLNNSRYTASCGGSSPTDGTTEEPLDHLSCLFAWYLYWNFGLQGRNVVIVAHSMGGLIVRGALYQVANNVGTWARPPSLGNISDVITLQTPHGGVSLAGLACGGCRQLQDLTPGSAFLTSMDKSGQNPQVGASGTDWTLIGGSGQDMFVDKDSATFMIGGHKAYYVCDTDPVTLIDAPWCYDHGGILKDQSDTYDAHIQWCDGCAEENLDHAPMTPPIPWKNASGFGVPHGLHYVFYALWLSDW